MRSTRLPAPRLESFAWAATWAMGRPASMRITSLWLPSGSAARDGVSWAAGPLLDGLGDLSITDPDGQAPPPLRPLGVGASRPITISRNQINKPPQTRGLTDFCEKRRSGRFPGIAGPPYR